MPLVVHCGQCERRYEVADSLVGRTFRCKSCGTPIPTQAQPVAVEAPPPARISDTPAKMPATRADASKKPLREQPVEKSKPVAAKPVRREPAFDELEIIEDAPRQRDADFEDAGGFLDDEIDSPQQGGRRSRGREAKSSNSRSRRSKSGDVLRRFAVSPKWIVTCVCVLFGVLVVWWVVRPVVGFFREMDQALNKWGEQGSADLCKIKLPRNVRRNFVMHPGSSAVTTEMSATSATAELKCSTVLWNRSMGAGMDSARIFDAVRESWARPWGAAEQEEPLTHQGIAGREFRGSKGDRESTVRAFVNRYGLIVLQVRNRPGQKLSEQDREAFLGSLEFEDEFLKAAPTWSRIDPQSPAARLLAERTVPTPVQSAIEAANRPIVAGGPVRPRTLPESVAEVQTAAGKATRVTREFRVSDAAPGVTGAAASKEIDQNSAIQKVAWNVPVDPPLEPVVYDTSRPLNVVISAGRLPQTPVVVFGSSPSPCVVVGVDGQERVVWNLATRQKLGTIPPLKLRHSPIALSQDGRWIAAQSLETPGALTIWDVAAVKPKAEWTHARFDSELRFLSPSRLLTEGSSLHVYDIVDGRSVCEIKPPNSQLSVAGSPGGRTLAVLSQRDLVLFDAEDARELGRMTFGFPVSLGHLAFSPDGTLLGLAAQRVRDYRLCEINVADGQLRRDFVSPQMGEVSHESFGSKQSALHGFPGNGGWLFGDKLFVRSELEGVAWSFDTLRSFSHRHQTAITATADSIIRVASDPQGGKLIFETIGSRALEATKGDVQVAVDALLPKLTAADWSQVVEVLPASQPKWIVPRSVAGDAVTSIPTLTFELGSRFTRGAALTSQRQLAVLCQPTAEPSGSAKGAKAATPNAPGIKFSLELYDILPDTKKSNPAPAKPTKQVTIPFPCDLIDVSPSSRFALVRAGQLEARDSDRDRQGQLTGRLDVIDMQRGAHLVGWRPFFDLFAQAVIAQAAFIDDEHVLTMSQEVSSNQGSVLALWKLPECRAVYVIQGVSTRTLSPDRRMLGISRQLDSLLDRGAALKDEPRGLFVFDAVSGATLGHLAGGTAVTHAAFHPREPRLFALTQHEAMDIAIEWDLQTGKILREFPLPSENLSRGGGRQLVWTGTDHLLLNGRTILDLKRQIYSAVMTLRDVIFVPQNLDSRAWFLGELNRVNHLIGLGAFELPNAKMNTTIQLAMPKPDLVLQPGSSVGLAFQLAALPGEVSAEVQKRVRDRLELLQIKIVEQSDTMVVVSAVEEALGTTATYSNDPSPRGMFGSSPTQPAFSVSVSDRRIVCRFQISRNNKIEGEFRSWANNDPWRMKLRESDAAQETADQYMQSGAKRFLLETRLPPYLFSPDWRKGLTAWQLSPTGIEQQQAFGVPR